MSTLKRTVNSYINSRLDHYAVSCCAMSVKTVMLKSRRDRYIAIVKYHLLWFRYEAADAISIWTEGASE